MLGIHPARSASMNILAVTAADSHWLPALGALLQRTVDGGASLGFLAPLPAHAARGYWEGVLARLGDGLQLWLAEEDGQLLGCVQLAPCTRANGRHRGEVQKLMVDPASRGRGVARALLAALEAHACARGLRLLVLDTEKDSPAQAVYTRLGWQRAGEIPDFALRADASSLAATVLFFKQPAVAA